MTLEELKAAIAILAGDADATAIYEGLDEYGRLSDGFAAKVETLEGERDDWHKKYEDAAARNYELMTAVTAEAKADEAAEDAADDEAADVTKLFKEEK